MKHLTSVIFLLRNSLLEVSYLHPRTGKMTYWQSGVVRPGNQLPAGAGGRHSASSSSLLELSETVWSLRLERSAFLLILLVVLFSCQSTELYSGR